MTNPNPEIAFTTFAKATLDALKKNEVSLRIDRGSDDYDLADGLTAVVENITVDRRAPRFVGFAVYDKRHTHGDILGNSAAVLEYEYRQYENVVAWAEQSGFKCYVVNTERTDPSCNKVALIIPFTDLVAEAKTYTRIISLLAKDIDLDGLSEGSWSRTFLIEPAVGGRVRRFTDKPFMLDGYAFYAMRPRLPFTEAKHFVGRVIRVPRHIDEIIAAQQRASVQAAQLDEPDNLIVWPKG